MTNAFRKILILGLIFFLAFADGFTGINPASAQSEKEQTYTLSGFVKDNSSGEILLGANIVAVEPLKGTVTNPYGFYSLTLPEGEYTIKISYLGYQTIEEKVNLNQSLRRNYNIDLAAITQDEVVVVADKKDNTESTQMGIEKVDVKQIKKLPVLFGEVDILKTLQLLPGVQSAGEGNSGFYVRGGGPDQNLVLLDEAIVYNTGHLLGFFSVFNADAINDVTLIKGGMPAEYGGRLSSVVDVSMREGNNKKFAATGGIGLISSRLTVEGPIQKEKSSFMIAGRRTYIDVLTKPFRQGTDGLADAGYFFYDLNAKLNYTFSDKDRIFLSGYFGEDVFSFNSSDGGFGFELPYGNQTGTLRWNHLFNDKMFMNATAIYSDYEFSVGAGQEDFSFKLFSGVQDQTLKLDFDYFPHIRHKVKFGGQYIYHIFTPSTASGRVGEVVIEPDRINKQYAHEAALYVSDDFDVTDDFRINAGLRYGGFMQVGPYDLHTVDEKGNPVDTVSFSRGEKIAAYDGFEPRIGMRYKLSKTLSAKASYTYTQQFLHQASFGSGNLPGDLWIPSSTLVKPQTANQYAVGLFKNFADDRYETSVEVYYKDLDNLVEFKENEQPGVNDNLENKLTFGTGQSYGAEFFIKKRYGRFNGWLGYTWSKTTRQFDEIDAGREFFARYDRRHDASLVTSYALNDKWTASFVFVYGSGSAFSLPAGLFLNSGNAAQYYAPGYKNNARFKPYHRADVSFSYTSTKKRWYESNWVFAIYNVYNRKNQFIVYTDLDGNLNDGSIQITPKQVSIFPIIPSISWNFKF